jgi:hypothetical protein
MGILKQKPLTPTPSVRIDPPKITPDSYIPIIVDDSQIPLMSLSRYVEGSRWVVSYYIQVITSDTEIREHDPLSPNSNQQYELVRNIPILVSSPLSPSDDSDTGISTVTGDGVVPINIIPNPGDYFEAEAGLNELGLFRVTNVERKTHNLNSVFSIDYDMVGYVTKIPDIYTSIVDKTIRTYEYLQERLDQSLNPIITTTAAAEYIALGTVLKDVISDYFRLFYNPDYGTLVIPGQDVDICDYYLIDFIFAIIDREEAPEVRHIKQPSKSESSILSQPQFWEMMLKGDYRMLDYINTKMRVIDKSNYISSTFLHGIYYFNVDYLLYPIDRDDTIRIKDRPLSDAAESLISIKEVSPRKGTLADSLLDTIVDMNTVRPYIKPVTVDEYYVLSADFYLEGTSQLSVLEILVKDYLKGLSVNQTYLTALCASFRKWGRLEQFYYGPILMVLIKYSLGGR